MPVIFFFWCVFNRLETLIFEFEFQLHEPKEFCCCEIWRLQKWDECFVMLHEEVTNKQWGRNVRGHCCVGASISFPPRTGPLSLQQIDHVLISKRRTYSIMHVRTFRSQFLCSYLVQVKFWQRISCSNEGQYRKPTKWALAQCRLP